MPDYPQCSCHGVFLINCSLIISFKNPHTCCRYNSFHCFWKNLARRNVSRTGRILSCVYFFSGLYTYFEQISGRGKEAAEALLAWGGIWEHEAFLGQEIWRLAASGIGCGCVLVAGGRQGQGANSEKGKGVMACRLPSTPPWFSFRVYLCISVYCLSELWRKLLQDFRSKY